jgi:hypothetical protein
VKRWWERRLLRRVMQMARDMDRLREDCREWVELYDLMLERNAQQRQVIARLEASNAGLRAQVVGTVHPSNEGER